MSSATAGAKPAPPWSPTPRRRDRRRALCLGAHSAHGGPARSRQDWRCTGPGRAPALHSRRSARRRSVHSAESRRPTPTRTQGPHRGPRPVREEGLSIGVTGSAAPSTTGSGCRATPAVSPGRAVPTRLASEPAVPTQGIGPVPLPLGQPPFSQGGPREGGQIRWTGDRGPGPTEASKMKNGLTGDGLLAAPRSTYVVLSPG